jgi:membrane-associated phospholipid phosphatase
MKGGLPDAVRRRLDPVERYGLRLTLVAAAIVLVAVPFSSLLFQVLAKGPVTRLDGEVANDLNARVSGHPTWVGALQLISWFGRPPILVFLVAAAVFYTIRRGRRRLTIFLVVTPLGGAIVDSLVKILVNRPRPVVDNPIAHAIGKSFPSGHAMSSMVTYGSLILVFLPAVARVRRPIALLVTAVMTLGIGISRLFLGVHFVSDVVGGWVLGLAWLLGAVAVFQTWRVEEGRRPAHPLPAALAPAPGAVLASSQTAR